MFSLSNEIWATKQRGTCPFRSLFSPRAPEVIWFGHLFTVASKVTLYNGLNLEPVTVFPLNSYVGALQREGIMEASPSGNLGQSVKVHVHLKLYKELTDLNLVQELHSHTGREPWFNPQTRIIVSFTNSYLSFSFFIASYVLI